MKKHKHEAIIKEWLDNGMPTVEYRSPGALRRKKMETKICENERCTYHRRLAGNYARTPYAETMEDGELVRVERHLYRSQNGNSEFFLCDVCHAAVQMVVTPNANQADGNRN